MRLIPRTVLGPTQAVVTEDTVLMDWINGGDLYQILFYVANLDLTQSVTMVIETSETGSHPDINAPSIVVPPGRQGSLEIGPAQLRRWWRLLASSESPGFTPASVIWGVRGCERLV